MGADFSYALVDLSIKKQDLIEYVKTMSNETVENIADYQFGTSASEYETDEEFIATTKANIIGFIDEAYDSCQSREVGTLNIKGTTYLLTGGMSWGDDPTDAFRSFYITEVVQEHYLSK